MIQSKGSSSICMMIVPLVTAIVLVVHLEDPSRYNVAMIFIPFFIVVGLFYLITLCAFYAVVNLADDSDAAGAAANYTPPQQSERDTGDSSTPLNPIAQEHPIVIPSSEPIVHVPPAATQESIDQPAAARAEQAQPQQVEQPVQETHIDLDVD